jgi:hypothetical protein
VPTSAKEAITITARVYETIIPFSWAPAPGQTQYNYVFPTRSLLLENSKVSLPRISKTLAPRSVLVHTIQLESRRILSQKKLAEVLNVYTAIITTAVRTGRLKPATTSDALAMTPAPTGVDVVAVPQIMYRSKMYRNTLHLAKVYIDDFGNFEYDTTLKVKVLLEGLSGTNAYQLSNILLAMEDELTTSLRNTLDLFVISHDIPQVVVIPGSCVSTDFTNDGNVADAGCGRGCAHCQVGYACFDNSDCLSGLCSTGVTGNTAFIPIMDEDMAVKRGGFRGTCLESVFTKDTSGALAVFSIKTILCTGMLVLMIM